MLVDTLTSQEEAENYLQSLIKDFDDSFKPMVPFHIDEIRRICSKNIVVRLYYQNEFDLSKQVALWLNVEHPFAEEMSK